MNLALVFIDDEEDILNLVRLRFRKLISENTKLYLFSSSLDFEKFIDEVECPNVAIVTDINMPNNKVLKKLEENRCRFQNVISYFCSAYDQAEFQDMMDAHKVKRFFKKPLSLEAMKDTIINDLEEIGIKI